MSTLPTIRVDKDRVKKLAREMAPSYLLYNPAPEWFSEQYAGCWYYFPPDLGGEEFVAHPTLKAPDGAPLKVLANGILKVKDRYGYIYGKRAVPTTHPEYGYPMGYALPVTDKDGKIEEQSADKVVEFFTRKFGLDAESPIMALGLCLLSGDPEVDEIVKAQARKGWTEAHRAWAEGIRRNRVEQVEKYKKENPGRSDAPPMSAMQRKAEEILLNAEEDRVISTLAFVCEFGDYETDEQDSFEKHIRIRHPEKAKEAAAIAAAQAGKRPRGRPRKVLGEAPLGDNGGMPVED